jgi:hypothetical protein
VRLMLAAVACAAVTGLAIGAVSARAGGVVEPGAATQPRPFRHTAHQSISCLECHRTGPQHRSPRTWTADNCAACHHDARREMTCARCHAPGTWDAPRITRLELSLSVRQRPEVRPVTFEHQRHATLQCTQCHDPAAGVRLAPPPCASCHTEHHGGAAECTTCHLPPPASAHPMQVHLTCAGAECHALASARQPALSRPFCVLCHQEQRDHEPGGLCHECHWVPYREAPAAR